MPRKKLKTKERKGDDRETLSWLKKENDPESVVLARLQEIDLIQSWINDYYRSKSMKKSIQILICYFQ